MRNLSKYFAALLLIDTADDGRFAISAQVVLSSSYMYLQQRRSVSPIFCAPSHRVESYSIQTPCRITVHRLVHINMYTADRTPQAGLRIAINIPSQIPVVQSLDSASAASAIASLTSTFRSL